MPHFLRLVILGCLLCLAACQPTPSSTASRHQAVVSSAHPLATEAGLAILQRGGNAFDAAIAVAATLAVVEPYSAGMGGGGFWLLHQGAEQRDVFVDARETAPASAHRNMYLDATGMPIPGASTDGPRAAGIPGQAAAFAHIATLYGRLPLKDSLARAIELAEDGFPAHRVYVEMAAMRRQVLERFPESRAIFLPGGARLAEGDRIRQRALAETLRRLAADGHPGFYGGDIAQRLVTGVNAAGGDWQLTDLANYQVIERTPLRFSIDVPATDDRPARRAEVITAPPPSAGGIALAQMFAMLRHTPPVTAGSADEIHVLAEVMRRAYRDRALHLGDPAFVDLPLSTLLSDAHAEQMARSIDLDQVTRSSALGQRLESAKMTHTTHLSVVDALGNRVAATLSINLPFGSGFTVPGTGVLLNSEMDDFSLKVGAPNAYGLVGSEANAIAPGKRPLSSMTPTFMEYTRDGQRKVAVIGTPGGSRIISMVFLGLLDALEGRGVESWVSRPRFHHQYLPDEIQHEPEVFDAATRHALESKGHRLSDVGRRYGNMQAIEVDADSLTATGASDPRGVGQSDGVAAGR